MIEATGLRVDIGGARILNDVSLTARTGAITGIVGPNGCGKTTLLRTLIRAHTAAAGRISIDGADARRHGRRWLAARVAYVGQRADPDPTLSVAEEAALGAIARGGIVRGAGARSDTAVGEALAAVGLAHLAGARLGTLSGGELQRVGIARALVHGADHVLLDEPSNHLDVRHQHEVLSLVRRIAPTAVVVLHDLDLAARYCDEIVLMSAGTVVAAGTPADVLTPRRIDPLYGVRTHVLRSPSGAPHFSFDLPDAATAAAPTQNGTA